MRGRRTALLWAIGLAAGTLGLAAVGATQAAPWLKGYALYHGHAPLEGRIAGHAEAMPAAVLGCAGCHDAPRADAAGNRTVPVLGRTVLAVPRVRRGGPDYVYSAESFCTLLRSGIDPAAVMTSRTMPRFAIDDADCAALWTYLEDRG